MAKRNTGNPKSGPTLTPHQAIEILRRQMSEFSNASKLPDSDDAVRWQRTTLAALKGAFGEPNQLVDGFHLPAMPIVSGMPESFFQEYCRDNLAHNRGIVESAIEQIERLAPPSASMPLSEYRFHAEIERVSGALFRDGHYKQAAFEAYIRVIDEVKMRSALNLDGDTLMNQAFSPENNRVPAIKFNALSSDAEKDEQKGFMFLFKGIIGLRNFKAHSNQLFNDPSRAHEYLAMASLLMRMLELATR